MPSTLTSILIALILIGPVCLPSALARDVCSQPDWMFEWHDRETGAAPVLLASSAQGSMGASSAAQSAGAQTAKSSMQATQAPPPIEPSTPPATQSNQPSFSQTAPQSIPNLPSQSTANTLSQPVNSSPTTSVAPTAAGGPVGKPLLRENVVHNNANADNQDVPVESFFDCEPIAPQGVRTSFTGNPNSNRKKSGWHAEKFLWHVLDNAGVPMFLGNRQAELDPSISARAYINPPEREPTHTLGERIRRKSTTTVVQTKPENASKDPALVATPADPKSILHRIPQSELEGIPDEAPPPATDMQTPLVTPDAHAKAQ